MPFTPLHDLNALDDQLRLLVIGPPKIGKAQPIDEPVLTPTGWVPIGSLEVGMLVVGSDGRPKTVVGVFPQGVRPVVRMTCDDGAWTRCCEEHLWLTTTVRELKRGRYTKRNGKKITTGRWGTGSVKTAAMIEATLDAQHYLPSAAPVRFVGRSGEAPIDPYSWRRRIESIEDDGEAECVCIKIDAEDALYVTRGHILTHNTSSVVTTSPGPVAVINCDPPNALNYARANTKRGGVEVVQAKSWPALVKAADEAIELAKSGRFKTIVVDPFNVAADDLEQQLQEKLEAGEFKTEKGKDDAFTMWRIYKNEIQRVTNALFKLKANLVYICHEGTSKREGDGRLPGLAGQAATLIAAKFTDFVRIDVDNNGRRLFVADPTWGSGARSLGGDTTMPADVGEFIRRAREQATKKPDQAQARQANSTKPSDRNQSSQARR